MISYFNFIFNFIWELGPSRKGDHSWMENGKKIYIVKKRRQITAEGKRKGIFYYFLYIESGDWQIWRMRISLPRQEEVLDYDW